jgi:hypothetical protein
MKPITATILLAVTVTLCLSACTAQQSSTKKALASEVPKALSDSSIKTPPASKAIALDSAAWQRYSPSELGLSIELPGEPSLVALPPGAADQEMGPSKAYTYQNEQITIFAFRFNTKKPLPLSLADLNNIGAGFLDSAAKKPGISDAKNELRQGNNSTVLLLSTYTQDGVSIDTRAFVQTNEDGVWLIMTRFVQADEPARAVSLRVIQSVKID